jgi:hypothetical protein
MNHSPKGFPLEIDRNAIFFHFGSTLADASWSYAHTDVRFVDENRFFPEKNVINNRLEIS